MIQYIVIYQFDNIVLWFSTMYYTIVQVKLLNLFYNSMLDPIKVANCLVAACTLKLPMIWIVILIVILGMKQTIILKLHRKAQTH